jgi:hypothetical protein
VGVEPALERCGYPLEGGLTPLEGYLASSSRGRTVWADGGDRSRDRDQALDYAARKGMTLGEVERWLASNLNYEPSS